MPHREIQEANTNPMAVLWTTRNACVAHNKKLLHGESAALWANMIANVVIIVTIVLKSTTVINMHI